MFAKKKLNMDMYESSSIDPNEGEFALETKEAENP